ncbi:MAG: Gmad2 immunoglobulin-like domain-containing protein, partial [bacterium]|nr:Gmad2 immunoglobulin-like domain-containing protein [bacterium]
MRRILIAGFLVFSVGFGIISSANAQSAPGTEGLWAQLRALQSQLTLLMSQASQQGLSVSGVSPSVVSPSVLSQPTVVQEATRPGYITLEEVQGSPRVSCTLPSIKSRSSGPSVYLLQLLLKQEGSYPEGFVTGYYGRLTQAAVSRFQSSRGIPATGIVDAATAKQLTELTGKFYPEECGSVPKPTQDRLELLAPREGEAVSTTFTIAGYAYGWFEGNVPVKVRDTNGTTLFDGSVTASNNYDAPAYFKKEITLIQKPTTDSGWIEFTEYSERDGTLQYQKTVKIRFTTTGGQQCEYARPPQGCRWEGSMTYPQCEARLVCGATGNSGHVYQFDNINGFYVLRGDNLKSVQLWSIPTGTEITPAYYKHFDDMTLESDGSQFDVLPGSVRTQKWSKKVKECPLATNVFARAFDATGQQLPDVNLPVTGASALYEYLCGTTNQASITVTSPNGGETFKAGQQITVNWKTNSVPTNQELIVSLELSKSGKDGRVAFFGTLNDGSEIITIPKNIISGSFYKIFIETPGIDAQTQLYVKDYSDNYFTIISSTSTGPVISGVSGPQTLNVSQTGTWTVTVSARSGGNLSYSVDWGDGRNYEAGGMAFEQKMVTNDQSATFTHSYSRAGTYTPTFTVTNQSGQSAQTSLSVNVGGTTTPSITVTSPTAGNVFDNSGVKDSGLITTIQWQSSNLGTAAVSIELDDMAGNFVKAIAGWIASTGTYSWKYDPAIPDGNYKIKIYAAWPTGTEGRSGVFSLTGNNGGSSAAITVTSPNGGEIWASTPTLTDSLSGFTQYRKDITWSGAPDDPFNRIEAYLEQQVGGQYQTIGRIPPFAFGSVAWVVGIVSKKLDCNPVNGECFRDGNMSIVPPGRYFVRVVDRQTGAWDRSDAPFTITGQQVSSITVTSPQAGETWRVGEKYEIRWTKLPTGVAPEYVSLALTGANGTYFPITVPGALWYRDGQTAYVWEASKVYDSNGHQWTDVKLGEYKISLGYSTPGASHGRITVSSGLFKVVKNDQATNLGPVISGVSGPQSLNVNQQGTWTVSVSSNSGGNLSYSVDWGDGRNYEA